MTRRGLCFAIFVISLQLPLWTSVARADVAATQATDEVNFPISCGPASQKAFNHAVWTLHSFWYPEALKGFTDIATAEPGCAMAYWALR